MQPHGRNLMLPDTTRHIASSRLSSGAKGTPPWLLVSAAFVTTGGQDRANFALASFLARRGDDVHLVSHRISGDIAAGSHVVSHAAPRPLHSDLLGEPFLQWIGKRWAKRLRSDGARVVVNGGNC